VTTITVSHARFPRRASLLWTSNLTGIDIVIPDQPVWPEDDIEESKSTERSKISRGSALVWMDHLNVLKWFVNLYHLTTSTPLALKTYTVTTKPKVPHHSPNNRPHPRRRYRLLPAHPPFPNAPPRRCNTLPAQFLVCGVLGHRLGFILLRPLRRFYRPSALHILSLHPLP
jgi:hypothetical protein